MAKKYAVLILVLSLLLLFSGCVAVVGNGTRAPAPQPAPLPSHVKQVPPPWAPAHGHRAKHRYRYYPSSEIYFDSGRRLYFYYRNGSWCASASLPGGIRLNNTGSVILELDTEKPYTHHADTMKKYQPLKQKKPVKIKKDKFKKK